MAYYNRNGEKLDIDFKDLSYVGKGECARVSRFGDRIFKQYYTLNSSEKMNIQLFDELRTFDNKHLMKIYDIYSWMSEDELQAYKMNQFPFSVDAYTAKYYEPDDIRLLYEPTDYFLTNLTEIEELFDELANNNIEVNDIKISNTISNNDGIVIIDPDLFYNSSSVVSKDIKRINKRFLLLLFKEIMLSSIDYHKVHDSAILINNVWNDFSFGVTRDTCLSDIFTKKMIKKKKPIDYYIK